MMDAKPVLKRWANLKQALERHGWMLNRISGSHHIFTKSGKRCIPVAFHGGTVRPKYASLVLRQAGIVQKQSAKSLDEVSRVGSKIDLECSDAESRGQKIVGKKKDVKVESKHRIEATQVQNKEAEYLKKEYEMKMQEKDKQNEFEEKNRTDMLEKVQNYIANGNYKTAIKFMSSIKMGEFGSSDDSYSFYCDILFYRVVAISEYCLNSLPFNSKEQHKMISGGLDNVISFIEKSPERRKEGRELATKLKELVLSMYLNKLHATYVIYFRLDLRNKSNDPDTAALYKSMGIDVSQVRDPTSEEIDSLIDQLVTGFQFVVSIIEEKEIHFGNALSFSLFDSCTFVFLVDASIRKMLIRFDFGDHELVQSLSTSVHMFGKNHPEVFTALIDNERKLKQKGEEMSRSFLTSQLVCDFSIHLQRLIPIYEFAIKELDWERISGFLEKETLEKFKHDPQKTSFDNIIIFAEKVLAEYARIECSLTHFVREGVIRKFILDTLIDPVFMINLSSHFQLIGPNGLFSNHKEEIDYAEKFHLHDCTVSSKFRTKKYDKMRVDVIRLLNTIFKLLFTYEKLLGIDKECKELMHRDELFIKSYIIYLPELLIDAGTQMFYLIGAEHRGIFLLHKVTMLLGSMNIETHNYMKSSDDGTFEIYSNPQAAITRGNWHFADTFIINATYLLERYLFNEQYKKLKILDNLADESVLQKDTTLFIESLLFSTLFKLLSLNTKMSVSHVESKLRAILNDSNEEWLYDGPRKTSWIKQKSKKYSKMIERYKYLVQNSNISDDLSAYNEIVEYILDKLKESVMMVRKIPVDIKNSVKSPKDFIRARKYVKQWSLDEIHSIANHLIRLDQTVEIVSIFFNNSTGFAFPKIISITNSSWSLHNWVSFKKLDLPAESLNAIVDIRYMHAIISSP